MDEWTIAQIEKYKRGNMEIYKQVMIDIVGKELPWKDVKRLEVNTLRTIARELKEKVLLEQSPINPLKLSHAIQSSRSGIGGCAMTNFKCSFCGKEEVWGNTAVPNICKECAGKMAYHIAKLPIERYLKISAIEKLNRID